MIVKELLAILNEYPEDMRIVLEFGETSLDDVGIIQKIPVILDTNNDHWRGPHEECKYGKKPDETALLISLA